VIFDVQGSAGLVVEDEVVEGLGEAGDGVHRFGPLWPGRTPMTMNTIKTDREGDRERSARAQSASREEAAERFAGLLPEAALQDALKGLAPEEITSGPVREATHADLRIVARILAERGR